MGQLLQMRAVWLVTFVLGGQVLLAQPQKEPEFCALRVTVLGYGGQAYLSNVPLPIKIVASETGKVWRSFGTKDGTLEVCDIEPHPFDVLVGRDGFGQVVVRNLQIVWGRTLDLKVMRETFHNLGELPPWMGCGFLVKVRDADGSPVSGSIVSFDGWPDREVDRFGRISLSVRGGATSTAIVKAPGFRETSRVFSCPKGSSGDQRVTIELQRAEGDARKSE